MFYLDFMDGQKTKNNLRALRHAAGLTQAQLGKLCTPAIPAVYVSRYEAGIHEMRQDLILQLSKILKVSPSEILGYDDKEFSSNSTLGRLSTIPLTGFINPGGVVETIEKEDSRAQTIPCPEGLIPEETLGFISDDPCFYSRFRIYADVAVPGVPPESVGEICIVDLPDGSCVVRRIEPGSKPGYYDLYLPHHLDNPQKNCLVKSSSFIRVMVRA